MREITMILIIGVVFRVFKMPLIPRNKKLKKHRVTAAVYFVNALNR